jgi:uncharacterized iron-regulated membrane protein
MRKLMLNLHLYTALIAGLVIVILGTTGAIMVFESELDVIFHRSLFKVQPGAKAMPVADVIGVAKAAYPQWKFRYLVMPAGPDRSYYAMMVDSANVLHEVFVDGYTGRVVGARTLPTALDDIHQLHLRLLMPAIVGRDIVFVSSLVLIWLVVSGLYLWWPLKRTTVKLGASLRRIAFDLHSAVGIYTFVFLFVLAVTGALVHFDDTLASLANQAARVKDPLRAAPSAVTAGAKTIGPDQALSIARAALPGTKPNILMPPAGAKGSYRLNMYFPEDLTGNRSWVLIDQYSGKVLFVESSRAAEIGNKLILENRAIHTGQIYGYPTKVLMSFSSLMVVVMAITGYYMWWKKLRSAAAIRARASERAGELAAS